MHRLAQLSLDRPIFVCATILVATAVLATGISRLDTQTGYRAYLGASHPTVVRLDRFIDRFGGGLPMAAVWSCGDTTACEDVFDPAALRMAREVSDRLESVPGVLSVETPATTRLLLSDSRGLGAVSALDHADVEHFRRAALEHPLWRGQLVSEDGRAGAIIVELASSDSTTTRRVLDELEAALEPYGSEQGFRFHIVGQTAQFALTDESLADDSQRLLPITLGLVCLVVLLLFRSWRPLLAVLATVGLSSLWTMGGMGLLGWPQNAITQTLPPLILVIAMCDAIHLLSRYERHRATGGAVSRAARSRALLRAAAETGPPCLVTTLTTAAGFASFAMSGLESFFRFGIVAAAGITAALLLTFSIVPLVMAWLPGEQLRGTAASERWSAALATLVQGTRRRAWGIVAGSAVLGAVGVYGVALLRVDVDEYKLYGEQSAVVKAFRFLETHLRLPDSVEIEVLLPEGRSLHEPAVAKRLETLTGELSRVPGLGPTRSLIDAMSWVNQATHDGDRGFRRLGETVGENAQILTLFALKDPASLASWAGLDFRRLRLSAEAEKLPQSERRVVLASVREVLQRNLGPGWETRLTGSLVVYHDMVAEIHATQLWSFGAAALVIFVVLALFLRSRGGSFFDAGTWALGGMLVTLLPVVITLGVMGHLGIHLDMGTAMVGAIIIGIAVDDVVHILMEYRQRRLRGDAPAPAIEGAVLHTGRAVVTTSLALMAGFFVLLLSSWQSVSSFGFLSGVAITAALIGALVVLPALVYVVTGQAGRETEEGDSDSPREEQPYRRTRVALSTVALLPVLAILGAAATGLDSPDTSPSLPCRVAPNGGIPIVAGSDSRCPLRSFDRVSAVLGSQGAVPFSSNGDFRRALAGSGDTALVEVIRGGERRTVELPVVRKTAREHGNRMAGAAVLVVGLMGFALWVYWQSHAAASPALLVLAAALSVEMVSIICASHASSIFWIGLPAGPLAVAGLGHLVLTFPRERPIVRQAPILLAAPYLIAGLLVVTEIRSLQLDPTFWELSQRLLLLLAAGSVALLGIVCFRALHCSRTPLEVARARTVLVGSLTLPVVIAALWLDWGRGLPGGHLGPLLLGSSTFLLAIGHAIVRYDLFDVSERARTGLAQSIHYSFVALLGAGAGWLARLTMGEGDPLLWAVVAVFAGLSAQGLRRQLLPALESALAPSIRVRRRLLRDQQIHASHLLSEDLAARLVGRTLEAGLDATGVAIFLVDGAQPQSWRPAYVGGEAPAFRMRYARLAAALLRDVPAVHFARGDVPIGPDARILQGAGIELIVAITDGTERYGLILAGRPRVRVAYSREEVDFVRTVAANAAMAIEQARATEQRLGHARIDAARSLVQGIAHDLGRPLRVVERRAARILGRLEDAEAVSAEASEIAEISRHLIKDLYAWTGEDWIDQARRRVRFEDVIERAVRHADDSPGQERVLTSLASDLPLLPQTDGEKLIRVVANLLDNALAANRPGDPVSVFVTEQEGRIEIEIEDQGLGMRPHVVAHAFDLYFTTRRGEGGSGIGLPLTKEMIEDLDGTLELESQPGQGTRVVIRFASDRWTRTEE